MKSLAEVAYDAYHESRRLLGVPSFDAAPYAIRLAFADVARAVVAAHERNERSRKIEAADRAAEVDARRFGVQG